MIRSDGTIAAFDATNPATQAFGDAAAVGVAAFAARRDHKHPMMANPVPGAIAWTTVVKTGDENVAASTTLQNDDELFYTAVNGGVYEFQVGIIYDSPLSAGVPDIKVAFGEDTATRGSRWFLALSVTETRSLDTALVASNQNTTAGTAATKRIYLHWGWHVGAGGTFRFSWAQNTSDANPTTVYAGSYLAYRRIV